MSAARRLQVRVADVVGGAFRVWVRSLPQLLLIAALAHAPMIALRIVASGAARPDSWRGVLGRALPLLDLVVSAATEACVVVLVLQRLRGERPTPRASLRAGARRLGTVFGITAILNAPNGASAVLDLFSSAAVRARPGAESLLASELTPWDVGVAVFKFLVGVCLCGPIAVAVVERRGVIASIGRSWLLTRGFRLTIAFAYLLLSLAAIFVLGLRDAIDLPASDPTALLLDVAGDLLVASFTCVVPTVIFHELREARESSGGEHLVEVFG
ncbi:MAG TPA: hypothetical protein VFG37_02810 [Planctomycetota bacterium]|nr:hypothetical protein [Planctomycetota bacterium]